MSIYDTPLTEIRREIKDLDKEIIKLFEKRMDLLKKLAYYKKSASMNAYDPFEEMEIIKWAQHITREPYNMYVHYLFNGLFQSSKSLQENIFKED